MSVTECIAAYICAEEMEIESVAEDMATKGQLAIESSLTQESTASDDTGGKRAFSLIHSYIVNVFLLINHMGYISYLKIHIHSIEKIKKYKLVYSPIKYAQMMCYYS